MDAFFQSLVRDRPDDLGGTTQGPEELHQTLGRYVFIIRRRQRGLDQFGIGIVEQHGGQSFGVFGSPVGNGIGRVFVPESDRRDQHQFCYSLGSQGRQFSGQHTAERMAYEQGRIDTEAGQHVVISQYGIPHVFDVFYVIRLTREGAGEIRRINRVSLSQPFEKRVPLQTTGRM